MPQQWLDETSIKAFRAAKFRYFTMIGAIATIALACSGILIYQQIQKNRLTKLANEYAEINSLYYQENLQMPDSQLSSNDLPNAEPFANHTKSMTLFASFAMKHPKNPYGWQAGIRAGNYNINRGNLQVAKELFETIILHTTKYPIIQIKLGMALAGIYAEQNDAQKSLQQLDMIQKIRNNPIPEQTKLFHAKILHVFNKENDARQILNTLNSEQAKIWLGAANHESH